MIDTPEAPSAEQTSSQNFNASEAREAFLKDIQDNKDAHPERERESLVVKKRSRN